VSEHLLGKILVERPCAGLKISRKKLTGYKKHLDRITKTATEDGLLDTYVIKNNRWRTKKFSSNLSPLCWWLYSKLGEDWDTIYNELCQKIDRRILAGKHLLFYLDSLVIRNVISIDGAICAIAHGLPVAIYGLTKVKSYQTYRNHSTGYWRNQLYVHPETNILCLTKRNPKLPEDRDINFVIDRDRRYHKINNLWYLVKFKAGSDSEHQLCSHKTVREIYKAIDRQQAKKRVLKRHKKRQKKRGKKNPHWSFKD
jgi:hypothetical protein